MAGVNKVILLGNLGRDPEARYLESGSVVVSFSIATSETYKDRNGNRVDTTEWHNIEMWDGLAKVAEQYLKKGDMVYVEGKIKTESWTDNEGNQRKSTKIRATTMQLMPKVAGGQQAPSGGAPAAATPPAQSQPSAVVNDPLKPTDGGDIDDLPF